MKQLIARWLTYRQCQRKITYFFTLFEQETVALRDTMIALAEIIYGEEPRS